MKFNIGDHVLMTFRGISKVAIICGASELGTGWHYNVSGTGYPQNWLFKEEYLQLIS